nr:MAG TPA: hypothetical protein [Ackermannviridae sp.]
MVLTYSNLLTEGTLIKEYSFFLYFLSLSLSLFTPVIIHFFYIHIFIFSAKVLIKFNITKYFKLIYILLFGIIKNKLYLCNNKNIFT